MADNSAIRFLEIILLKYSDADVVLRRLRHDLDLLCNDPIQTTYPEINGQAIGELEGVSRVVDMESTVRLQKDLEELNSEIRDRTGASELMPAILLKFDGTKPMVISKAEAARNLLDSIRAKCRRKFCLNAVILSILSVVSISLIVWVIHLFSR